jgi:hypothetical protein
MRFCKFFFFACLIVLVGTSQSIASAGTVYYVSPSGSDKASGSWRHPFLTISKAASLMNAGDGCHIFPGTYPETVTPARSGTDQNPIKFVADHKGDVIVAGCDSVTNWHKFKGEIYSAKVDPLEGDAQVYSAKPDGFTALLEARWPHIENWSLSALRSGMAKVAKGSNSSITDSRLSQTDGYWDGATVWLRGGFAWLPQTSTIRHFESATHSLNVDPFTGGPGLDPNPGNDYYITNSLNALDGPGQYYYDKASSIIYVWPLTDGTPSDIDIKRRISAFDLDGRSYIQIDGIHVVGANITMNKADHCVLDHVTAKYLAYSDTSIGYAPANQMRTGIAINGSNNIVRNCDIGWSTGSLVSIDGNDNEVVNNFIHDGDLIGTYAPLVYMSSGKENLISHNTLRNAGRYGIYVNTSNSNMEFNDISNFMWLSEDGGGIYCWGVDLENSRIDHNIVHDSRDFRSGNGIYLDNYDENAIVDHNVVYNVDNNCITLNTPSSFELVYNNTLTRGRYSIAYWGQVPYDKDLYGDRIANNIFVDQADLTDNCDAYSNIAGPTPGFVNDKTSDYALVKGAAAIGKGTAIPGITDGYLNAAPDCGAYEFGDVPWTAGWNPGRYPDSKFIQINVKYMNRVKNSGFESGLEHWSKTGTGTAAAIGVPSEYPWQNRGKNMCLALGGGTCGVTQKIEGLAPNTRYKLTAWVYAEPGEAYRITVSDYGSSPVTLSDSNATYTHKEIIFTTGGAGTTAAISLDKTSNGAARVIADDFGLTEE